VNADDKRVIIGALFLGLGVFLIVYYLLYVHYDHPDNPLPIYMHGIVSAIVGLVLIRSYSRAKDNRVGKKKGV
jgi:hypothetical protein